jgi:hypothetical protein
MTETITTWRAEPLTWGRGPRQFEMFLEPTCPYSARAFAKIDETLAAAGSDNITIKIRQHSQERVRAPGRGRRDRGIGNMRSRS